ncbi:co-chaperone DjlA [Marinobacter lutaoensis]|uniref:co-chaperone DjlA n=1 Tax=Marinobacter lutaoensis TaxID=135739 RepID=UPI000C0B1404|nr:co-chaperone DjlA [Marinobacter lutaoensis]MBE02883.1 co-chaperone DjlA [Marinobacter sp.]MBI42232.1 co-chaperone DjlA [Oceanospirillales bacterium]NVD36412.1 co-chaperone DjlA [Marinobacter lutaoensis]|tara:strand:+ start:1178 stop:1957 length:780 start_codon:yes stop_codon:yes gene_type:complete
MLLAMFLGGLIGYAFGRFPGFLVGAALGAFFLHQAKSRLVGKIRDLQNHFLESVFSVMGALCKADGVITRDEIQMAEAMFVRFRLDGTQREAAKQAFNRGKSPGFDLDAELDRFLRACGGQPALLQMFLQVQVSAVAADGVVHPQEHEMLVRIARRLGLPESQVDQLEAMLRGAYAGQSGSGGRSHSQQLEDAYKVLGVRPSASDAEVKRAYRKLMSENHPDKLAGKGLPESMRELAEERTREISHAYDVIKDARRKAS